MTPARSALHIGIVANEPSGDQLGAALLRELRELVPHARFSGVAGPRMQAVGCESLFDMERLSVMGFAEVLVHLPELLALRRRIVRHFYADPPAVFIGVDAPDFNLGLERRLRRAGIPAVHLVSPTVWAWRTGRVKGLRRAVDLVLSIFPFEESFLRQRGVSASYIGHPLADAFPLAVDRAGARAALGLPARGPVIALLPGSRMSEVSRLTAPFIATARRCLAVCPELAFVVPLVNARLHAHFAATLAEQAPELPLRLLAGRSREALAAADCVLTASGTATLEALLSKRPMVVAYRMHWLTYRLVKWLDLIKVPHVAMANLLVGRELAPEFIQERCRPELMAPALLELLANPSRSAAIADEYDRVHRRLRRDAARSGALAVLRLIGAMPSGEAA